MTGLAPESANNGLTEVGGGALTSRPAQPRLSGVGDPPWQNRALFADHFLSAPDRLRADQDWLDPQGLEDAFDRLRALWSRSRHFMGPSTSETQTEVDWIQPVLRILGWHYEVQQPVRGVNRTPDYALVFSEDERKRLQPLKDTDRFWEHIPVLADAKRWDLPLDRRRADETPNIQIARYLYHTNVRWGILTNGRLWRLYEREKSRGGGIFFEVDLIELLEAGNPDHFKWFYLFFRPQSFQAPDGPCFVERVLEGSQRYAAQVGDHVRDSVYDALRLLMTGLLRHPANGLDSSDPDALRRAHDLGLIILYRLLFLLYAEDADLLPVGKEPYATYSLRRLQAQVNTHLRSGQRYPAETDTLWHRFLNLCRLIDRGEETNGQPAIPAYNGGLFSPQRFPEIAHTPQPPHPHWTIGDAYFAQVVDILAYQRPWWGQPGTDDIDYKTLGVRHLGSIYEGLLELKPHVATEEMIEQPGGGRKVPTVVPAAQVQKPKNIRSPDGKYHEPRRFRPGDVYLITDKGERRATGSYYTPEYVVNYIVDQTVVPLCDQAADQARQRHDEIKPQIDALRRELESTTHAGRRQQLLNQIRDLQLTLLQPYLSLKILDPAMGSGHFLVGAADAMSLAMATDPNLPEELVPDEWRENPQGYYKQLVVEHCLYGVDLNPLAVELAKVSLWLHTVQQDKALSFLDHHLRCGNSLIGAWLREDLMQPPPQLDARGQVKRAKSAQPALGFWQALSSQDLSVFLNVIERIVRQGIGDAEVEREKEGWFADMDRIRDRYRQVANIWLAPYFGVPITEDQYERAVEALRYPDTSDAWRSLCSEPWFLAAFKLGGNVVPPPDAPPDDWRRVAAQAVESTPDVRSLPTYRFFHWELEFPEVFFYAEDAKVDFKGTDDRGFHAVIGNPPYVRQEGLSTIKPYLSASYRSYQGTADIYVYFLEQSQRLARPDGHSGLIVSNKFMRAAYGERLRRLLAPRVRQAIEFGLLPVFPDATVRPVILITAPGAGLLHARLRSLEFNSLQREVRRIAQHVSSPPGNGEPWALAEGPIGRLVRSRMAVTTPLRQFSGHEIYRGVVTGLNQAFVIDSRKREEIIRHDPASAEIIKPVIPGDAIRRYEVASSGLWLIFARRGIDIQAYPGVKAHLQPWRRHLTPKATKQQPGPGRKPGDYQWYEIQDTVEYWQVFEGPKIVYPDIATGPRFALAPGGLYCLNTVYLIPAEDFYLLAILNSALAHAMYRATFELLEGKTGPDHIRFFRESMMDFPIRLTAPSPSGRAGARLLRQARALVSRGDLAPLRALAQHALSTHAALHGPAGKPELQQLEPWRTWIKHADPSFPGREDFVHDLLALLAQRMIDLNRQKQRELRGFVNWLQTLGIPVQDLQGKTYVQQYHLDPESGTLADSPQHLFDVLSRPANRRKLPFDPRARDFRDRLAREWEASMSRLVPLLDDLRRTDHLIDQIVYMLYGLTEEDIEIIERTIQR